MLTKRESENKMSAIFAEWAPKESRDIGGIHDLCFVPNKLTYKFWKKLKDLGVRPLQKGVRLYVPYDSLALAVAVSNSFKSN